MRWAQRFGYGRVTALLYGVPRRQASGLFSFLKTSPSLVVTLIFYPGDYTMNQNNTSELVKSLSFENHPLHMFLLYGKPAFLTKEVGEILGISKPTQSVRQSKVLEEGIDHALSRPFP